MSINLLEEIAEGIKEAKRGNTLLGLNLLQNPEYRAEPAAKAWYGYCLAYEKNALKTGVTLCREALNKNPRLSDGYLALGRIYLNNGDRKNAIDILEQGRRWSHSPEINNLLNSIGTRKKPVVPFLDRRNVVNVSVGKFLGKLGLR